MNRPFCILLLALIALAVPPARGAETPAIDFDAANKLYEQGKFAEAAAGYEGLLQTSAGSVTLYYNLGNARFKSGEIGRALTAYRQARQLAPRDPDVRANLQFIRNQVQGPTLLPTRLQRWLGRLTLNEWAVLASVALWLWLLLLALGQFRPGLKPALRSLVWLSGGGAITLAICLGAVVSAASMPSAIVTVREAAVRNGPLEESKEAFTVHDGAELRVLDHKDDWLQVSAGGRRVGWLKREQVLVPEDPLAAQGPK